MNTLALFLTVSPESIGLIVLAVYVGTVIGIGAALYNQHRTHAIVTALIASGANSPERAMTLRELGIGHPIELGRFLKKESNLRRVVLCANENEFPKPNPSRLKVFWYEKFLGMGIPMNLPTEIARFYIPEENRIAAEMRYRGSKHNPIATFIGAAVLLFGVAYLTYTYLPGLLDSYSDMISSITDQTGGKDIQT